MEAIARARFQRISPRKIAQVLDVVRGKRVSDAIRILSFVPKNAATVVKKTVQSAAANYGTRTKLDNIYISSIWVTAGPPMKRLRARAQGRGAPYRHPTSHLSVVVSDTK